MYSSQTVAWAANELKTMGPLSRNEWIMSALVLLAMFLWVTGSNPTTLQWRRQLGRPTAVEGRL